MRKGFFIYTLALLFGASEMAGQPHGKTDPVPPKPPKVLYGIASFYANKFEGRETANGEIFSQKKLTAACNVLPLGTWIKVTNLRNGRSVIVKVNDRLHQRMKRIVDLSKAAADKIHHRDGLTRVKVEVLGKKKPEDKSAKHVE